MRLLLCFTICLLVGVRADYDGCDSPRHCECPPGPPRGFQGQATLTLESISPFIIPPHVSNLFIRVYGGGGSGAGSGLLGPQAGGGGSSGYVQGIFSVNGATTANFSIGAGGASVGAGLPGNNGGATNITFGTNFIQSGGGKGGNTDGTGGSGGGATVVGPQEGVFSSLGAIGGSAIPLVKGGDGAAAVMGGVGGFGATALQAATGGVGPGAGGGGGFSTAGGRFGGSGLIIIQW